MVQTIGSAGEALAAGAIFTMPALFMWAEEGLVEMPSLLEISLIALCGGILGTLFMIPLRTALIVKEHGTLAYPEGQACAQVLIAGEEGGNKAEIRRLPYLPDLVFLPYISSSQTALSFSPARSTG